MSDEEAPKSAYELAMARLRQKDKDAGIEEKTVTEAQRTEIAEVRKTYEARLAEREIMYKSQLGRLADPAARETLDEEYRRDRERLSGERERKIEEIRGRA
jgi:hypothetical protein